jgi:hypothetical protein
MMSLATGLTPIEQIIPRSLPNLNGMTWLRHIHQFQKDSASPAKGKQQILRFDYALVGLTTGS